MKHVSTAMERTQIELDEAEPGAIVVDRFGHAWQQGGAGYWYRAYDSDKTWVSFDIAQFGPFTTVEKSR